VISCECQHLQAKPLSWKVISIGGHICKVYRQLMSSNPEISKTTWQTGYKLSFKCCFLYAEKRVVQCYITVVFRCVCERFCRSNPWNELQFWFHRLKVNGFIWMGFWLNVWVKVCGEHKGQIVSRFILWHRICHQQKPMWIFKSVDVSWNGSKWLTLSCTHYSLHNALANSFNSNLF